MAELFERDGHCEHCGCPIYTDPMMGTHCACPPWEPKPAAPADGHAWTFDPYHQAHRCTQCGIVSYDATPAGPCTCAPSTWLPPGPDDAPVLHVGPSAAREMLEAAARGATSGLSAVVQELHEPADFGLVPECEEPGCSGLGEVIDGARILCRECAPKVDDATLDLFDPFAELRRMGEEARAEPMTADDEKMLESIKAAVRRKLGET